MAKNLPCSCITRDRFHLVITYTDQKTLVIHDRSQWVDDEGFLRPSFYDIDITWPDKTTKRTTISTQGHIVTDEIIKDGVYTFTLPAIGEGCGIQQTVQHFLYPGLMCRLMKARLRAKYTLQADVEKVAATIKVMEAAARAGDQDTADRLYRVASLNIDALQCDCNCTNS